MQRKRARTVVICGIRGIPACYGGFETFAEHLSTRLLQEGYHPTVYGRRHVIQHSEQFYRGVRLVLLPAPRHKYLETPVHTLLCFLHLVWNRPDVVLVCNGANAPFLWILRLARIKVAINVDGIERQRAKWNALGRLWYRFGEVCSVLFANAVVSDAEVIRRYYRETYRADSTVIPYGYNEAHEEGVVKKVEEGGCPDGVRQLNLEPGEYVLYVSRLEPENHAHTVIAGYNALPQSVRSRYPLVIVGDAPYAAEYIAGIKSAACPEVRFLGYQFGATYELLQLGAALYVQATEVGGTHPALVEAMGFGNCVLANDTPENREVLGEAGCFYRRNDAADLASHLQHLLESPEERQKHRRAARYRAEACYSWHSVVVRYDALFSKLLKQPPLCTLQTPS